jgi:DNA-binding Lrp family transcriptional regulator
MLSIIVQHQSDKQFSFILTYEGAWDSRMWMIDEVDKQIIHYLQGDLPVIERPFAVIAEEIGISEAEFLERVELLKRRRILRRFGATLRHQLAGFDANAMVAWRVSEDRVDQAGRLMAAFREKLKRTGNTICSP